MIIGFNVNWFGHVCLSFNSIDIYILNISFKHPHTVVRGQYTNTHLCHKDTINNDDKINCEAQMPQINCHSPLIKSTKTIGCQHRLTPSGPIRITDMCFAGQKNQNLVPVSVSNEAVSDLEAGHPEQQEGGQEGVEEHKVQRVARQGPGVALVDDLTPLGDQTRPGDHTVTWDDSKSVNRTGETLMDAGDGRSRLL